MTLAVPDAVELVPADRLRFVAIDARTADPCAIVLLPGFVARWRGPLLAGGATTALGAALLGWPLLSRLPWSWFLLLVAGLAMLVGAGAARVLGLFAPPIQVSATDTGRCEIVLQQRPDWRVLAFHFVVRDDTGVLGRIDNVLARWNVRDAPTSLCFEADDRELRWVDLWRRVMLESREVRTHPLTFESQGDASTATVHWNGSAMAANLAGVRAADRPLLFAACLAAHLAFTRRL